ncbi:lysophospholipid acyltransferase family protein [Candidatus Thiosymbion oneisti]|uniref:lysophospholipid acyltransferase family protein n=1 Tax=Candidatus Thiosymbion oneisti TaxID=589554 RepID=UPI001FB6CCFB|nr:lysophospholipid acyltransferase family protein [Candidatus Thiosymbion oneisti]
MATEKDEKGRGQCGPSSLRERFALSVLRAISRLPLSLVHLLGVCVGWLMLKIPNKQRRNALINVRLCFPHLQAAQALAFRRRSFLEYGKTYSEVAYLWLRPTRKVLALVRAVSGRELLHRDDGRGVIVLSPHLGAWELAGLYLSAQGPTTTLYKPQPELNWLIREVRGRAGAELVPTDRQGIRKLMQALRRGEYVGILPDQEPRMNPGSVFAPFFGVPALTMLLINRLARKTGARVIFLFAVRLPRARGFHIHCLPAPVGVDSADETTGATALNRGIEHAVNTCPEQYLWAYKRFRRRPPGMPNLYQGPL